MLNYDPYDHADALGLRVVHRRLTTGTGLWVPDWKVIFIQERLRRVHDRSALAHELGHACLGHRDDRPKHEVMADRFAAENMINRDELVDLMKWSPDPSRWSLELGVSTRLIRVWWNLHHGEMAA
ncbi:ImmA/IrrE family metallo-endopeptidase [Curtobacterium sp. MCBD17_003]|uniref:ImmA/IrrE family metallo-endopeptidase n=1 Tax=Curtobacterium sp. MCBD17_003 TaxID=2175667 RepID=UPI0015E8D67F|nr:ImmA/IrrE family metallo-endopeptidase [Curtobacterium sp. MCBD17_003]WIE54199.1 ImmA/IrrE family metallo-endopeptidase [Curtobacterium sp. MCBD17_003]